MTEEKLTSTGLILPRVAAGEAEAMGQCLSAFGGLVWSVVRRYLRNQTEAEDLVQEIFIEIWKKAASFNPAVASETTFVGLIARRRAIDHLRRQGRKPDFEPLSAAGSIPLPALEKSSVLLDSET
ncbi:MAG: RNA polymerase sigma factor, partial [Luteolibacter sp.]